MKAINADELVKYFEDNLEIWRHPEALDWAIGKIKHWEPLDVAVRQHGKWIIGSDGSYMCSECGKVFRYEIGDYCSICGARLVYEE